MLVGAYSRIMASWFWILPRDHASQVVVGVPETDPQHVKPSHIFRLCFPVSPSLEKQRNELSERERLKITHDHGRLNVKL